MARHLRKVAGQVASPQQPHPSPIRRKLTDSQRTLRLPTFSLGSSKAPKPIK
ncbi:hypothetical protein HMPREF0742_00132 [Rothia aeria F0184]|uniref:Uncharacterized protein n=1 Tax=Rothia aeria F0184 TaxID=888019 RepID=U7V8G7_9MICC|nr:hypothetical protein HMPREF0742_00132 [Rothia aeria F0184]